MRHGEGARDNSIVIEEIRRGAHSELQDITSANGSESQHVSACDQLLNAALGCSARFCKPNAPRLY